MLKRLFRIKIQHILVMISVVAVAVAIVASYIALVTEPSIIGSTYTQSTRNSGEATNNDTLVFPPAPASRVSLVGPALQVKPAIMKNSDSPEVWDKKSTFNFDFVGKPWFDCPDGRNKGLTYTEMDKFVPCINGSALIHLKSGKISIDPKMSSNPAGVRLHNGPSVALETQPSDWDITLWHARDDNTILHVDYKGTMVNSQFESYVRVNGGSWKITRGLDLKTWKTGDKVDIVLTWVDPLSQQLVDAPVPFDWKDVPKNSWFLVRN